ncbi:ATP-dependent RNA helicase DOB1 [Nosema granulosis]|uniref:ATP-dependent RNA helicase DOB1 n=1 Tax=Nosema granulosis TaxID=83296 RepID=A0A9P6GXZ2_9MICR|nr:ATP-dependent RNA helicase DOB1 [Nosema granulosis]
MNQAHLDILEDLTTLKSINAPIKQDNKSKTVDKFERSGTRHEAAIPLDKEYTNIPEEFQEFTAKKYNFELDVFQKISLCCLERDESVLVSAHTSSGKTVVAEYAIAMSLRNNQRVVYTSPIKALSNQKYRELLEEFHDVGLMTGDVTINPTASCLVMTTEILRNMLYRGSEVIREIHWIIFDEIHYMRDRERGVVWEETIILVPSHVRMVFLSATIPNALEFAEWISYIQKQIVHVVYTEKRITPLVHYFRTNKLYKIKDNEFHKDNFHRAMKTVKKQRINEKDMMAVIDELSLPAVVFSFRRKDCEYFAMRLEKDFLKEEEKKVVRTVFNNAIEGLRKEDREIPIIQNILPLLTRGIGIHHSGLLPIVKEIVEILFQEGYLKVLFATETFSIGLNMPAKSVVFVGLKKFDGIRNRPLSSAEYIQMSGRAGRRGIDKMGIVVSLVGDVMTYKEVKELFSCTKDNLISAFRLTYNMILNLMRVEGLDPLYLISRSFHHFQAFKQGKAQEAELFEMYEQIKNLPSNLLVQSLQRREQERLERCEKLVGFFRPFLKKGRVVDLIIPRFGASLSLKNCIVEGVYEDRIGVYILTAKNILKIEVDPKYVEEVYDIRAKLNFKVFLKNFPKIEYKQSDILKNFPKIDSKQSDILKNFPKIDSKQSDTKQDTTNNFDNFCFLCKKSFVFCLSDCSKDFVEGEIVSTDLDVEELVSKNIEKDSPTTPTNATKDVEDFIRNEILKDAYSKKFESMSKLLDVYHMDECKKMIKVLKALEYCDDTTVLVKGRLACEISTGDELVLTEMLFNGDFTKLAVNEFVPLLSCLVFEEWNDDDYSLSEENKRLYSLIEHSVNTVCGTLKQFNLVSSPKKYLRRFSYELMDVVRMWVDGKTFIQICENTEVFEGSIIRTFKRLEELLKQLSNAARVIGNVELENMFSNGILSIKRDIVFANSLYI